jgi:hypothetical protein
MALLIALAVRIDAGRDTAQGHAVVERHVIAELAGFADDDAHAMIDKQVAADLRARMDFDTRQPSGDLRYQAGHKGPLAPPKPARQAVKSESLKARIAQDHLKPRAGGRIARHHGIDFLDQRLEHHFPPRVIVAPRRARTGVRGGRNQITS